MAERHALPRWRDSAITIAAVLAAFFSAGLVGAAIPYGWTASLVSGLLFIILLLAYGLAAGPGRRSGGGPFVVGGILVLPALIAWFAPLLLSAGGPPSPLDPLLAYLRELQVGGSLRRCGHAADFCGILWWVFTLLMIGVALALRELALLVRRD